MPDPKMMVARKAAEMVGENSTVGVGSGSTVHAFIAELAKSGKKVTALPTSQDTLLELARRNIPVTTTHHAPKLELCFDGADQIDRALNLIKGGGGALTMEKIVAYSSAEMIVLADSSKLSDRLGSSCRIPVEFVFSALPLVQEAVESIVNGRLEPRKCGGKLSPIVSENGLALGDIYLKRPLKDPPGAEELLKGVTGILESGIFSKHQKATAIVSDGQKTWTMKRGG